MRPSRRRSPSRCTRSCAAGPTRRGRRRSAHMAARSGGRSDTAMWRPSKLPCRTAWRIAQHRRRGLTRFAETGFPSRKSESWRYLDLQPLARDPLLPAAAPSAGVLRAMGEHLTGLLLPGKGPRLVLVDGHFAAEFSSLEMPEGVWFGPTSSAITERPQLLDQVVAEAPGDAEHPFAALN